MYIYNDKVQKRKGRQPRSQVSFRKEGRFVLLLPITLWLYGQKTVYLLLRHRCWYPILSEQLDMEDNLQLLKLAWKNQPTLSRRRELLVLHHLGFSLSISVAQTIYISPQQCWAHAPQYLYHRLRVTALLSSDCKATFEGLPNAQSSSTTQKVAKLTSLIAHVVSAKFKEFSFPVN